MGCLSESEATHFLLFFDFFLLFDPLEFGFWNLGFGIWVLEFGFCFLEFVFWNLLFHPMLFHIFHPIPAYSFSYTAKRLCLYAQIASQLIQWHPVYKLGFISQ